MGAEKLFSLDFPAGLVNNGTVYQSKDRWFKGNLVRFFQGNKQPVGGWVQRTLTGATITGIPNAAISWQMNDGNAYLAIGTTSNLYIVTSANVVYDITPATVVGDTLTHLWQLETFGTYLLAVFQRPIYLDSAVINAFVWKGVLATPAIPCYNSTQGPGSVYGVTVTPERFLVLLRGADPAAWAPDAAVGGGGTTGGAGGLDGGAGVAPTETPPAPTLTKVHSGVAHGAWTNNNHVASIRAEWSLSSSSSGPFAVTQTTELSAETTSSNFTGSSGPWIILRLQYFNTTGSGPWGAYSAAINYQ